METHGIGLGLHVRMGDCACDFKTGELCLAVSLQQIRSHSGAWIALGTKDESGLQSTGHRPQNLGHSAQSSRKTKMWTCSRCGSEESASVTWGLAVLAGRMVAGMTVVPQAFMS